MGCGGSKEKGDAKTTAPQTREVPMQTVPPAPPIPQETIQRSHSTHSKSGRKSTVGRAAGSKVGGSKSEVHRSKSTGKSGSKSTVGRSAGTKSTVGRSAGAKSAVGTSRTIKLSPEPLGRPIGNFDQIFGHLRELCSTIFSASKNLFDSGEIKAFPKNVRPGGIDTDWATEVDITIYSNAFSEGDRTKKAFVIAAVLSMFIWDSIQHYRFFDEPATRALAAAQKLHNEPDIPPNIAKALQVDQTKVKAETNTLIGDLGIKSSAGRDIISKLIELAARIALQLKKHPGELYLTYNPSLNFTPFARRKAASRAIYYWISKEGGIEMESSMRDRGAIVQPLPGSILYFPQVMLRMREVSGAEMCIIRQADYGYSK